MEAAKIITVLCVRNPLFCDMTLRQWVIEATTPTFRGDYVVSKRLDLIVPLTQLYTLEKHNSSLHISQPFVSS
jgi:hypothetical protein